jgi:hypothetical protein
MRCALLGTLLCLPLLAGCGKAEVEPRVSRTATAPGRGVTVELPPGWQPARASLTPSLRDPREVLSAGTFPLSYRETGCAHLPSSALEDLGRADALVTVQERGLDPGSSWQGFPPRPARFGPGLGGPSEASACVPPARFTDHWFTFSDAGRHFHVLVAFGPDAPGTVRAEAWAVLDSLRVDPAVRPD